MKPPDANSSMPFEEALQKLDGVVRALESGDITLEQSLARYEEGVHLLRLCYEELRKAEQRVRLMVEEDELGRPIPKPFPNASTREDEPRRRTNKQNDTGY